MNENTMSINFAEYDEHENEFYYDEQSIMKKNFDEIFIDFVNLIATCKHCPKVFSFNNKLHYYLRREQCFKQRLKITSIKIIFELKFFSNLLEVFIITKTTMYSEKISINTAENVDELKIIKLTTSTKKLKYNVEFCN